MSFAHETGVLAINVASASGRLFVVIFDDLGWNVCADVVLLAGTFGGGRGRSDRHRCAATIPDEIRSWGDAG